MLLILRRLPSLYGPDPIVAGYPDSFYWKETFSSGRNQQMARVIGRYDESRRKFEVRLNPSNTLVKVVDMQFYGIPRSSRVLGVFNSGDEALVQFGYQFTGEPQVEIAVDRWGGVRRTQL
jgi:hypothetical protein